MASHKLTTLGYSLRLYGAARAANRAWSPRDDMAAQPFPKVVQLQTINACQAACRMCPYPLVKDRFARGRMEDWLFEKIIDEVAGRPEVKALVPMLQNEPFLDKALFERIASFKRKAGPRVSVELVTNGAFLTESNIVQIRASGLDVLDISLDALSPEVYRELRVGLDYDQVIAGVERALAADLPGTSIFVRLIRLRQNFHEVKRFAREWKRKGAGVFIYSPNSRAGAVPGFDDELRVPETQLPLSHRLGRRLFRAFIGHCPVPFATANVLHDGQVLMCTHDWQRREIVGDLRTQTLAEVWNGPRMRAIRAAVAERRYQDLPACRECTLWRDGWF